MESKVTTENRELSKLYIKVKDQEPIFRQHIHKTMKIWKGDLNGYTYKICISDANRHEPT